MTQKTTLPALLAAALLAALPGCNPEFDPASEIGGLRVLAVRAEPPELAPPQEDGLAAAPARAVLGTLVAHPDFPADPARRVTVVHLACTPDPEDPSGASCSALAALADPAALLAAVSPETACATPGLGAVGAVTLAGVEACGAAGCAPVTLLRDPADPGTELPLPAPAYEVPEALGARLRALPPGSPERILGVEVIAVTLAVDAAPEALQPAAAPDACGALAGFARAFGEALEDRPGVAALKRLRVRGPDATDAPNRNPSFDGVALAGLPLPPPDEAPAPVAAGATLALAPRFELPPEPETYLRRDATGAPIETREEEWVFSWFATAGSLEELHTRSALEPEPYTAPGAGRALVYAVLRDLRGGVAWRIAGIEAR